jgi:hypothetical protein
MSLARFATAVAVAVTLLVVHAPAPAQASPKSLKCAFDKQRIAVKRASAILACHREALRRQSTVDQACITAAIDRFKDLFDKIEMRGGCKPAGDGLIVGEIADRCAAQILLPLQGSCTEMGAVCGGGAPPCCTGLVCRGSVGGGSPTCQP